MNKKIIQSFTRILETSPLIALSLTLLILTSYSGTRQSQNPEKKWILWYETPAGETWNRALPVGNGRLGAMVFGNVKSERIQMNEDTIWSGKQNWRPPRLANAPALLKKARNLLSAGKYAEAEDILQNQFVLEHQLYQSYDNKSKYRKVGSYQTMADLLLNFNNIKKAVISSYRRELNLDTAIAKSTFKLNGTTYTREVFSSAVDNALVVRLFSDKKSSITVDISLYRPTGAIISYQGNSITLRGQAQNIQEQRKKENYKNILPFDSSFFENQGVTFDTYAQVQNENGKLTAHKDKISIQGADSVTIYLTCGTDYWTKHYPKSPQKFDNSKQRAKRDIANVAKKGYQQVKQDSIAKHRQLFRRVDIQLDKKWINNIPTDVRLKKVIKGFKNTKNPKYIQDNTLVALYMQFGRYLSIASSLPNTMPGNLQGIWNYHFFAPWSADYHININLQMNYWHAYVLNLMETTEPYLNYIERLRPSGTITARKFYNHRGWTAHHTSDAWLYTYPVGQLRWALFPFAAAWNTRNFWKHYRYTKDKKFLRERAFPLIKGVCEFLLDYTFIDPKTGQLITGPSNSPENSFRVTDSKKKKGKLSVSIGTSMGQLITLETFENFVKAANILGKQNDPVVKEVQAALKKLAFPKIDKLGRVMEWSEEFIEAEKGHRHISHLYSLYPASHFLEKEEYTDASRKTIEYRLKHGGGHTGWSRAWIINFWARLKDSKKSYENVIALLGKSTLPNLFDNHPPFQIDGNFGGAAGIAETLIQSYKTYSKQGYEDTSVVDLLPSLPVEWKDGYFKGFRVPDGHTIDMAWRDKEPKRVTLYTTKSSEKRVFAFTAPKGVKVRRITYQDRSRVKWTANDNQPIVIELPSEEKIISIKF